MRSFKPEIWTGILAILLGMTLPLVIHGAASANFEAESQHLYRQLVSQTDTAADASSSKVD